MFPSEKKLSKRRRRTLWNEDTLAGSPMEWCGEASEGTRSSTSGFRLITTSRVPYDSAMYCCMLVHAAAPGQTSEANRSLWAQKRSSILTLDPLPLRVCIAYNKLFICSQVGPHHQLCPPRLRRLQPPLVGGSVKLCSSYRALKSPREIELARVDFREAV